MDALVSSHTSASHSLHSGRPGSSAGSARWPSRGVWSVDEGFGSRAERSVGRLLSGVTDLDADPLDMFLGTYLVGSMIRCGADPLTEDVNVAQALKSDKYRIVVINRNSINLETVQVGGTSS